MAKSALAETRRATDATLVAAIVTQTDAEFLRNERARAPVLTANFKYEPITIEQNGVSVAQIIDADVTYRLIRFQLSVENSGTRESQAATALFRLSKVFPPASGRCALASGQNRPSRSPSQRKTTGVGRRPLEKENHMGNPS